MIGTEQDNASARSAEAHLRHEAHMERLRRGNFSEFHFRHCQQIISPRYITQPITRFHPDTRREMDLRAARLNSSLTPEETQELAEITERQNARAEALKVQMGESESI